LEEIKTTTKSSYRVPVPGFPGVSLRAVSTAEPTLEDVNCLTEWRNRNVRSFLTEFRATPERTLRWLKSSIATDPARILFMVDDDAGPSLGYIGLASIDWERGYAEADSVVRGREGRAGVMSSAMRALLSWAQKELLLSTFGVRVLADNPANAFYKKLGFRERTRVGLRREQNDEMIAWREVPTDIPNSERALIFYDLPERLSEAAHG
jgi:RimJ/RimL family protein N-acetyltransferase